MIARGVVEPLVILSARNFADAVAALVDERASFLGGRCVCEDSTYARLRAGLNAKTASLRRTVSKSRAPLRLDVLALLSEIDRVVAGWSGGRADASTPERLRALSSQRWTPEDRDRLDDRAAILRGWSDDAARLLDDTPPEVPLRLPCPACGELWAYRMAGAERIRAYALRAASEVGASCSGCGAVWPVEQFDWLSRLLRAE